MSKLYKHGIFAVFLSAGLLFSSGGSAQGDTGGGLGGDCGPGGCTLGPGDLYWESWSTDKDNGGPSAYAKFKKDIANRSYLTESRIDDIVDFGKGGAAKVPGGSALCENSSYIWAITAKTYGWVYNVEGTTHGPGMMAMNGTIENPASVHDKNPTADQVKSFIDWDKKYNGAKIDKDPGYVIVCSGNFDIQADKIWKSEPKVETTVTKNVLDREATYSCNTEIKPQILKNGKDPIGETNLHPQGGTPVITNFGRLYNHVRTALNNKTLNWTDKTVVEYKALVDNALKQDAKLDCSKVNLDDENKKGMAEGGVLNVYEQKQTARIKISTQTTTVKTTICTYRQTWNKETYSYNAPTEKCETTEKKSTVGSGEVPIQTLENTGFWQILSVHCNATDFNNLVKATGAKVINTGDPTKTLSATAYSKKYSSQPNTLDFGDKFSRVPIIAKSGTLDFYDKECPIECTSSKDPNSGASADNGAVNNINKTKPKNGTVGKYFGAVSGVNNTNSFEFFRDNEKHDIKVDVWYPKNTEVVSYDGKSPLTTTINRWMEGTPSIDGSSGGKFTIKTGGTELFAPNIKDKPKTQTNWSTDKTLSTTNTTSMFSGLKRDFTVQATWASDDKKPHILNFKWEYNPTISTKVPVSGIGFDVKDNPIIGNIGNIQTSVESKCYANFGATTAPTYADKIQKNTGSGTINNLDGNLLGEPNPNEPSNLFIRFVRSTTE